MNGLREQIAIYCRQSANNVFRPPAGCLRHPYLVPGGAYSAQLWDWDSWWVARGLSAVGSFADAAFREDLARHATGCWKNFLENQAENGAIPLMIEATRRDPFDCSREDGTRNQAKPILAQFAVEIAETVGDFSWVAPYFDGLVRFLDRWRTRYGTTCGLIVWGSDVAIGADNDPAVYGRPEFSSGSLLLNCFFARDLAAAARLACELGRPADAARLEARAQVVADAIRTECWDPVDELFYTVDVQCVDQRDRYIPADFPKGMDMAWRTLPLKVKTASCFMPLWAGLATPAQAEAMVTRHWRANETMRARWGVRTLARNERMYAPDINSGNPSNWLGPIWVVTNFMTWEGFRRYGFHAEADALAKQTLELLAGDLANTGVLHECYHPDTGAPNFNGGFLSWNTLAVAMQLSGSG